MNLTIVQETNSLTWLLFFSLSLSLSLSLDRQELPISKSMGTIEKKREKMMAMVMAVDSGSVGGGLLISIYTTPSIT